MPPLTKKKTQEKVPTAHSVSIMGDTNARMTLLADEVSAMSATGRVSSPVTDPT